MKSKNIIVLLVAFMVFRCALIRPSIKHRVFTSKVFYQLGEKLPENILNTKSKKMTLAYAGQFLTCYNIVFNGILYTYGINEKGVIEYIATIDSSFKTQDGFSIRLTYGDFTEKLKNRLKCELGWAYYVPLDEEWNAAFFIGDYATERPPQNDDRITFFFQRK
jgi:hypothetical protein